MKGLRLMLGFFSRIPVGQVQYRERDFVQGIVFVPLIGLLFSAVLVLLYTLLQGYPLLGLILLFVYIFISGGLHLDGYADTLDGLLSGRKKERMLEIMKDSRLGSFGMLGLLLLLLFEASFLQQASLASLLFPFVGRTMAILCCFRGRYAREDGMGRIFVEKGRLEYALLYLPVFLLLAFFLKNWEMLLSLLLTIGSVFLMEYWIHQKIEGMTGDTIGFVIEASQWVYMLSLSILEWL